MQNHFDALRQQLEGEFYTDNTRKVLYATDASAYREMPQAVAIPRTKDDLGKLIAFARTHKTSSFQGRPVLRWPVRWWERASWWTRAST